MKKILEFKSSISDVKQINPLFSTCKVRIMYTGKNRNMSIITRDAVEKALPTLAGIPIVGEFSVENKDFKGHGGAIDLSDYKYIHTTKPYGFVPESATYEWEEIRGKEYLTISGCYLWTGRYEEAFSIVEKGKGQSMEIEVTDGRWNEEEEAYQIDSFIFSALCILGDEVEPAFEDASIRAYSLDKDSFKQEFSKMLDELKSSLKQEKEVNVMLKELLEKYSTTVEDLTAKGLNFNEISEDELEDKIKEVLEIKDEPVVEPEVVEPEVVEPIEPEVVEPEVVEPEVVEPTVDDAQLTARIEELEGQLATATQELETLREFKLNVEKAEHEGKVQKLFSNFQLTEEDVKDIDIHAFSYTEIEEKCYAILGRKMASKNFSKQNDNKGKIHLPLGNDDDQGQVQLHPRYGDLFTKYNQ